MTAGQSAAAMAAQVCREGRGGPLRRLARAFGLSGAHDARTARQAGAWAAGAVGEQWTAAMLKPLGAEGWYGFWDRSIPGARTANADHVLVPPDGRRIVLVDAKLWSGRYRVQLVRGRLTHGTANRDRSIDAVLFEADLIERRLGAPVVPLIAVHNAPVAGGGFEVRGVTVVSADRLLPVLRAVAGRRSPRGAELARRLDKALPRYVR